MNSDRRIQTCNSTGLFTSTSFSFLIREHHSPPFPLVISFGKQRLPSRLGLLLLSLVLIKLDTEYIHLRKLAFTINRVFTFYSYYYHHQSPPFHLCHMSFLCSLLIFPCDVLSSSFFGGPPFFLEIFLDWLRLSD